MTAVHETKVGVIITSDEKTAFIEPKLPHVGDCRIRRCPFCGKHEYTISSKEQLEYYKNEGYVLCARLTCNNCEIDFKAEEDSISVIGREDYATNVLWLLRLWNHRARDNYG